MNIDEKALREMISESIKKVLNERKVIKIHKSAPQTQMPNIDPTMGADPMAGGDPSVCSTDLMGGDPSAMPPMGDESPMEGGADSMAGDEGDTMGGNSKADYIKNMIDNLPPEDLKAAEGYIESLGKDNGDDANNAIGGDSNAMPPMGECVIFTKGQLTHLNEVFGIDNNDNKKEEKRVSKKKNNKTSGPFSSYID